MKTICATPITVENFKEYGSYTDLLNPEHPFCAPGQPQFYPDRELLRLGDTSVGISVCLETKKERNVIEFAEFHHNTGEGILCLDDDILFYCAPATETAEVPLEHLKAFLVPKGTFVCLKPGVWHGCQFPVSKEAAHILIVLPERTYAKDCICIFFEDADKIEIQ